jgi:hypothetical protein
METHANIAMPDHLHGDVVFAAREPINARFGKIFVPFRQT